MSANTNTDHSEQSIGQSIKDSFMSLGHSAPNTTQDKSATSSRLHPASDPADVASQAGMREHGSGGNGPTADFRAAGTAFEKVRKEGENPSVRASDHGLDGLKQHNAQ